MSGKRFQARAKTVQKLGRDGLVEQNMATGEEKRVSQRTLQGARPLCDRESEAQRQEAERNGGGKVRNQPQGTVAPDH